MDMLTLLTVNLSVSFIMTLTMSGLYLSNRQELCLAHWAAAGAGFFANSLLSLIHTQDPLPYWLGPPLGNALLVGSYLFFYSGISHYLKQPVQTAHMLGLLIVVYLLNMTPFAQSEYLHRMVLNFPLLICINLLTLRRVLQARLTQMRATVMVFFAVMAANMLQLLIRFVFFTLQLNGVINPEDYPLLHESGTMAVLLFMLTAMTSCMLLLVRQKTLQLQQQAETDALTGWLNRQSLEQRLHTEWQRCRRMQQPYSLLVFDIDHFKQINDRYGHQTGDLVLRQVGQLVAAEFRDYDLQFRIGGEEFLVCLPGVDQAQLQLISERVRLAIAGSQFAGSQQLAVSVSVGCATASAQQLNWQQLHAQADQALYQAKGQGRNRVICFAAVPLQLSH